jgi:hypothetical protein
MCAFFRIFTRIAQEIAISNHKKKHIRKYSPLIATIIYRSQTHKKRDRNICVHRVLVMPIDHSHREEEMLLVKFYVSLTVHFTIQSLKNQQNALHFHFES